MSVEGVEAFESRASFYQEDDDHEAICKSCDDQSEVQNSRKCINSSVSAKGRREVLGSLKLISQKYESLDYDTCESQLCIEEHHNLMKNKWRSAALERQRWFIILMIGVLTAFTAVFIDICIERMSDVKFRIIKKMMNRCIHENCLLRPYVSWILLNAIPVLIGSLLATYVAPVASGSGIPVMKCYLNGVKVPEVVRLKTLFVKAIGVILSVVGGLAVGKEGPMIHCGAVIAAGISQGKSSTLKKDFRIFHEFRQDNEKRDFVSAGAAAGVAAAFGAPVGGVLFSLEEGASFWNQMLTWRIFFCSTVSAFVLSFCLSIDRGEPGVLSSAGLLNFGSFGDAVQWNIVEIPLYVLMGAIGGALGALYNYLNYKLSVFRARFIYKKPMKVLESVLVAIMSATVASMMIEVSDNCLAQQDEKHTDNSLQVHLSHSNQHLL